MALKEILDLTEKLSVNATDYLHIKQGTEDVRIKPSVLFDLHKLEVNPHNVDKTTVGLSNVTDDAQLKIASNLSDVADPIFARANLSVYSIAQVDSAIDSHANSTANPHAVTKDQVGLGNVNNYPISHNPQENVQTKYASIAAVSEVQSQVTALETNLIPAGGIIMWSGNSIPSGWVICDGLNGTPDLRNKFIRGGDLFTVGDEGGTDNNTHSHTGTVAGHILSLDEMPQHQHYTAWGERYTSWAKYGYNPAPGGKPGSGDSDGDNLEFKTSGAIDHKYDYDDLTKNDPHSHGLSVDSSGYLDNKPPYYTLIFIQKL